MTEPCFLLVHQASELYGSDRMFLLSVQAIREAWPNAIITIHLPQNGPLVAPLAAFANSFVFGKMWVLRRARLKPRYWFNIFKIPTTFCQTIKLIKSHDVVYINTIVPFSYLLLLCFFKKPCFVHIHEFKTGWRNRFLETVVHLSKATTITNSNATAQAFPRLQSHVILNAIPTPKQVKALPHQGMNLLLIGRINHWKGHHLALDALKIILTRGYKNITLTFVGDVFSGQEFYKDNLMQRVKAERLENHITFFPFTQDSATAYAGADLVLVPSTEAEPFGLVAVEAMAHAKPVIAASHGGLLEIVVDHVTGRFFQPNNAEGLVNAIEIYMNCPNDLVTHGQAGQQRFIEYFQRERYDRALTTLIRSHVPFA